MLRKEVTNPFMAKKTILKAKAKPNDIVIALAAIYIALAGLVIGVKVFQDTNMGVVAGYSTSR
jgi:hypothetical protein